jgi:hypothetical protein
MELSSFPPKDPWSCIRIVPRLVRFCPFRGGVSCKLAATATSEGCQSFCKFQTGRCMMLNWRWKSTFTKSLRTFVAAQGDPF